MKSLVAIDSKLCGYELNFGAVALDKISID